VKEQPSLARRVTASIGKVLAHRTFLSLALALIDPFLPVRAGRVVLVTRRNTPFSGNLRIVADALAARGEHQIGVFRATPLPRATRAALEAAGITVFGGLSWRALHFILTSANVVLSHSARDAYLRRRKRGRRIVNLWHGVALKRIEHLMRQRGPGALPRRRQRQIARNGRLYDAMIASGPVDRLVMTAAFRVPFEAVLPAGLPRFDYMAPHRPLPPDLAASAERLTELLAGRRLVLYAPTFRDRGSILLRTAKTDIPALRSFLRERNLVLGVRAHPYEERAAAAAALLDGEDIVSVAASAFPEVNLLLRETSALVVDYSSIWVDFLLTDRPIIGLCPDLGDYQAEERGFIYDLRAIFPGPIVDSWAEVIRHLDAVRDADFALADRTRHDFARTMLLPRPPAPPGYYTDQVVNGLFPRD